MPTPENPALSPAAYTHMDEEDRINLLFEYLDELNERLCWVDNEMARHGFCAQCIMMDGALFAHECRERPW